MRWSLFLLIMSIFQAQAISGFGQKTEISLNFKNATVASVLSKIEDNSNFYFLCNRALVDLDRTISIQANNQSVEKVLAEIFKGTDVEYVITGRQIVLTPRNSDSSALEGFQSQQQKIISGRVIDSSGSPLPGVTVVVKGTTNGTITDADGNYSISKVPGDATLAFSFVGMKPQEVKVAGKSTINITMAEETVGIDEVVAIGYGTVKKKDLSGSVGVIKASQLDQSINYNIGSAMQGKIAGVSVTSKGGTPGVAPSIIIRGAGSLNNTDPLILVDDVPCYNINLVNPGDIESFQVLKDASVAAIYGSRAANGVILITTKTGKKGAMRIDATADYGVQSVKELPLTNSDEWVKILTQMNIGAGVNPSELSSALPNIAQHPQVTGKGTDWQDQIFHTAPVQNYYVGATGGSENLTYGASLGYSSQDGIVKQSGFDRLSLHVKSDFTKGRVKIGESITVNRMLTDDSDPGNLVGSSLRAVPAYSVYTADGEYTKTGESLITKVYNPVGTLNINHARTTTTNILANLYAEVNLIEGLKFRSSVEAGNNDDKRIYHSKKHDLGFGDTYAFNVAQNNANNYNYWQIDNTLSYEKTIAQKHSLNVVIGQSALDYRKSAFSAQDQGMADGLWDLNTGQTAGVGASVSGSSSENTLASYFGRVLYSYDNRYGFMALMRRDGSSRFGKLNPWGNFPSLSAHWNVANESFFKNLATPGYGIENPRQLGKERQPGNWGL